VAGSCEHGAEPSGSIKCREFSDYLSIRLASQEGLCSMELVSYKSCMAVALESSGAKESEFNYFYFLH
jgi:hypothetical protein